MAEISHATSTPILQADALRQISMPDCSPTLTILREATPDGGNTFTLKHQPMAAPELPPPPEKVRAGKRAHHAATLTGFKQYIQALQPKNPIAFYSDSGVQCALDENSEHEKEVIRCTLARHPDFITWQKACDGDRMSQLEVLTLLRSNTGALLEGANGADGAVDMLIGAYASLSGTLVHDADEFLDQQGRSAKFTVKRKGGANREHEAEDVPTEFQIGIRVLYDDPKPTIFRVLVRMSGAAGAEIIFQLGIESFDEKVCKHIDERLDEFAESAGFLCIRGSFVEESWREPLLPASIKSLMEQQTQMIAAMAKSKA